MINTGTDINKILGEARELAITWKHGFINYDHIFVAMLKQKCFASSYLHGFNALAWEEKIKALHPPTGKETMLDSVALTRTAELVVKHASAITAINNNAQINTVDVLLAIMSFDNIITKALHKNHISIAGITSSYFKDKAKKIPSPVDVVMEQNRPKTVSFFTSRNARNKEITKAQQLAHVLLLYNEIDQCIKVCHAGLNLSPRDEYLRMLLAACFSQKRDYASALNYTAELAKDNPTNADMRFNLSFYHDELGHYTEAETILIELLREYPGNDSYLNNRGFNLFRQQRYAEAIPFFEKAIAANPAAPFPYNNLGFSTFKLGDAAKGLSLIDKSLEIDGGNSFAYKHKGIIFIQQGDKQKALENLQLALKLGYTERYGDEVNQLLKSLGEGQ